MTNRTKWFIQYDDLFLIKQFEARTVQIYEIVLEACEESFSVVECNKQIKQKF